MAFELPALPFEPKELTPFISETTIDFHYNKHHQTYLTNLNNLIKGTDLEKQSLTEIIKQTADNADKVGIFNNAAQVFNHTFYWNSLKSNSSLEIPNGKFKDAVIKSFENEENFIAKLKENALSQFGSGWVWVVQNGAKIEIVKTSNADTPIAHNMHPLLTIDVWEHAYYLDYQNRRGDYVQAILENIINWDFAEQNMI